METSNLIESLVGTYRELNIKYRNAEESSQARKIVTRMRDDEIAFSQALKDHLTGVGTADGEKNEVVDGADDTLAHIISQFGSARATTLNMLKGIQTSIVWDSPINDGKSIRQYVEDLVQSDRNQLERLGQELTVS